MTEGEKKTETETMLIDPGHVRRDIKLIEKAVTTPGWVIPEKLLETLPKIMGSIAMTGTNREKTAATRVVVAMKRFNDMALDSATPKLVGHLHKHEFANSEMPDEGLNEWRQNNFRRIERLKRLSGES